MELSQKARRAAADITLALFGWKSKIPLQAGLLKTINWLEEKVGGVTPTHSG